MYKKEVTYKDYNGVERTETFYFNLTQTELTQFETSMPGGMSGYMASVSAAKDMQKMMDFFNEIMRRSYGEKSQDGRRLVKMDGKLFDEFKETPAYDIIFQDIFIGNEMVPFLTGIMPAEVAEKLRPQLEEYMKSRELPAGA